MLQSGAALPRSVAALYASVSADEPFLIGRYRCKPRPAATSLAANTTGAVVAGAATLVLVPAALDLFRPVLVIRPAVQRSGDGGVPRVRRLCPAQPTTRRFGSHAAGAHYRT